MTDTLRRSGVGLAWVVAVATAHLSCEGPDAHDPLHSQVVSQYGLVPATVATTVAPSPLDNGACMSNADCPADYPNCCQVGGYASCFEESCEDVGGTPKSATPATTVEAPAPADNGACMSKADCPADYPNCCQVGGYASCFEESCEDVGGTPKSADADETTTTRPAATSLR